jgi:large subunit ribosomal protein L15
MLNRLKAPKGANKRPKRVGRGESSGHGKTSCRGGKGQTARKGNSKPRLGFEGGQMPMFRRAPKRGFKNPFRTSYAVVNVGDLERVFDSGDTVDPVTLASKRLITKPLDGVKLLGDGELKKKLTVKLAAYSASAKSKVEAAGGTVVAG